RSIVDCGSARSCASLRNHYQDNALGTRRNSMADQTKLGRRAFLTGAGIGAAAAASASVPALTVTTAEAQTLQPAQQPAEPAGYTYLKPTEVPFVEALVDHMIPKDELTGSGTELGIATYIDRALAGSWGKGDRLYQQGPWQ